MKANFVVAGMLASLVVIGCDSSSEPGSGVGELQLTLVDAPAAYDEVNIEISSVAVHTSSSGGNSEAGWTTINDVPATFNLLELRNGVNAVLGRNQLPAAHYTQIRLMLSGGSSVVVDGTTYPLEIPSGIQTGVKLTHAFTIEEDKLYELTLDFDADRSVTQRGNNTYNLQPTIRIVATVTSGTISGIIVPDSAKAVIYALSGTDTIATAYADTLSGAFKLVALPEGSYDVSVEATVGSSQPYSQSGVVVIRQRDTDIGTIVLN